MSLQRAIRPKTFYSAILLIILTLAITITNRIATTENAALPAPGGVDTSLQLWLKADAGVYNDAGSTLAADTETVIKEVQKDISSAGKAILGQILGR